ncbi:CBS domain-containing protein [Anoxybacillus rupiensis]|uniref:CBS domain-containing protein n=1 Tax=Anoxybacteroides rupiense TaxID=311460 RepID=A0ABD5ITE8_9BACL|nr:MULTISPECIES: CBS domain-containing protein [Anoxybacillus]KXG11604.1 Cobalt-dependent inorganic pyrophosphatase [Anoxybacillus sp. P3H1B]MBB3907065.1 putative transcriptional regulator [Anoxybacillus rupiensis]MBS2771953.1 CBS domain-containing protein [Anoxybacillus rupiensis]MDE8562936.1 CBS domain-containing protein [Anoxybacillus rupiensis]MED5051148.1 CBS domain-containing protein [Anoxybacillus rupiensis]
MATKHEQILQYIDSLPVGEKISVRQIAKEMGVSEGTAYRAIKDAENKGYVSTIERVGTIRIERKKKENIEKLTYAEVVNIVDGQVLGGREGLYKTLNRFVIGAMKLEAMMRYTGAGDLLIVGNRTKAHQLALEAGAAVLITGGFDTDDYVKKLADELQLPIISTSYDTFTVATMINRAIYDQLIKKEIVLVEDILIPFEKTVYLETTDIVEKWYQLNRETKHSRFPVVDHHLKVQGMVTSKDVLDCERTLPIEKVMTKYPITVNGKTSVAFASHIMVWEGIELLPVVDDHNRLQGIISRQDVLKALQMIQRQPQVGETIDDLITGQFQEAEQQSKTENVFQCTVTPQMTNYLGTLSYGVFTTIVTEAATRVLRLYKRGDLVIENITIYFIKPVQIDSIIDIKARLLEIGRKFGKVDVEVYHDGVVVGKALMMCQLMDR